MHARAHPRGSRQATDRQTHADEPLRGPGSASANAGDQAAGRGIAYAGANRRNRKGQKPTTSARGRGSGWRGRDDGARAANVRRPSSAWFGADGKPRRHHELPKSYGLCLAGRHTPELNDGRWIEAVHEATSRRVIRQRPISSGSNIQTARAVPARAHCVLLSSSWGSGRRARLVSSHGATSAKTDSEDSAAHAGGRVNRTTMAGAEASTIAPNATPVIIPPTR